MLNSEKINLGGKEVRDDSFDITEKFDKETQAELKDVNYEVLGKGETSCVVLPKPLEKTFSLEKDLRTHTKKFLLFAINEEGNTEKKLVTFELFQNELGDNFTNTKPLDEFRELLASKEEKEKKACEYKRIKDDDVLIYPPHIIHSQKKQDISGLGISAPSQEFFLEDATKYVEHRNILEKNKKAN